MHRTARRVTTLALIGLVAMSACSTSSHRNGSEPIPQGTSIQPSTVTTVPGTSTNTSQPETEFGGAEPAPSAGIYFGLFDNASGTNQSTNGGMGPVDQLVTLESTGKFRVAIDMHYVAWSGPLVTSAVTDDLAASRIPLISWHCGDTDANIIAGKDDSMIANDARSIAALGKPVMIRWFWEMEVTGSDTAQNQHNESCLGTNGAPGYGAAWRHIVDVFRANGATNVAWVFCPGQSAYTAQATRRGYSATDYYPGNSYVDWIAEDAYSRARPTSLASLISGMYKTYGNSGKPLMLSETGAEGSYQTTFLQGITKLPSQFPNFKALVYFDSKGPNGSYILNAQSTSELASLAENGTLAKL